MGHKLHVGDLAYGVRGELLQQHFSNYGNLTSAKAMMDRDSGRSKGFSLVEWGPGAEVQAVIRGLNNRSIQGRAVTVDESHPRGQRPGGFGGEPRARNATAPMGPARRAMTAQPHLTFP